MKNTRPTDPSINVLAILDQRLAELERRRVSITAEILRLEKGGAQSIAPDAVPKTEQRAYELLAGGGASIVPPEPIGATLHGLITERQAIDRALFLGAQRAFRLRIETTAQLVESRKHEWRELIREHAKILIELRRSNQRRQAFRQALVTDTGGLHVSLPHDRQSGLIHGPRIVSDQIYTWLEELVAGGVISRKELGDA